MPARAVPTGDAARRYGKVFNQIAGEYDRHRPTYPEALIDQAFRAAGLRPGAEVLEIGCGSGQLTGDLLRRGLRVTAVEPGDQLIAKARTRLQDVGAVRFITARLEDAPLPSAHYPAVFSASAIHWVDPDLSWQRVADALVDGGTLGLVSYVGLEDPRSLEDQASVRATLARIAPDLAAGWSSYRDLDGALAGVAARRGNVSEVWSWLGGYDLGREYAGPLFEDAQITAVPVLHEHTGEELNALLATMSFWSRLSLGQREAVAAENVALHRRLGRPIRSSTVACLVTARRVARA